MPCRSSLILLCVLVGVFVHGDAQSPPADSTDSKSASVVTQPQVTIQSASDLVVVDVTVQDSEQYPVHHISASDFTIFEDGQPQAISVFEEHVADPTPQIGPSPKLKPGMFTNYTTVPANGTLNIILFDTLNTPLIAQTNLRSQVLKFLEDEPLKTPVAIFSLSSQLKLLQGFTSDPAVLRALVQGPKAKPAASILMNNAVSGDVTGAQDRMVDLLGSVFGPPPRFSNDPVTSDDRNNPEVLAALQQSSAERQSLQLQRRAQYTLDALSQLARFLSSMPGRKNLIWFSGSFPVSILPNPELLDPFAVVESSQNEYRQTVRLLTRSQVAVYPIDARGLSGQPILDAGNAGRGAVMSPDVFARDSSKYFDQSGSELITMSQMAEATGGVAYENRNDMKEAIVDAINAGSNYYTLAYSPSNRNWNGSFRKIEVKLNQTGTKLKFRHGYFADDPNHPAQHAAPKSSKGSAQQFDPTRVAMQRGAPDPTEVIFAADIKSATSEPEDTPTQGNQPMLKVKGPFRKYSVHFIVSPREVNCPLTKDGTHRCMLEFRTYVYDSGGALVNAQFNGAGVDLSASQYENASPSNIGYVQQISVPVKGEYFLRLGVHDVTNDRLGALELPFEEVANLVSGTEQTPPADTAAPRRK